MEEMNEKKKINKNIVFSVIAVILLVVVVLGATVAYFSAQAKTELQTVTTAKLALAFTNGDIINATNIMPISDSEIKTKATELPFSVTNTGDQHAKLTISLTDITISNELKDVDFRWGLFNADTGVGLNYGVFKNIGDAKEIVIYRDTIIDAANPDITKNYILRIWIHDDGALQNYMQGRTFSAKVTVDGEAVEYTDEDCFLVEDGYIVSYGEYASDSYYDTLTCPTDVVIPRTINGQKVTGIGAGYHDYNNSVSMEHITSIIIPDTVTSIGSPGEDIGGAAIRGSFKNLTVPESVKYLGRIDANLNTVAISDNTRLTDVEIGGLGNNLSYVTITNSITDYAAFAGNNNLTDVVIMDGVKELGGIDYYDYYGNTALFTNTAVTSLEIPASVTHVYELGTNLTEIVVRGKTSLDDFADASGLTKYADIIEFRP